MLIEKENTHMLELFQQKIHLELESFRWRMLRRDPEIIYQNAYRIEYMAKIKELLLEISETFTSKELEELLIIPNLLAFFYSCWIKTNDSQTEELQGCILKELRDSDRKGVVA